jgi:hypothetical protein
VDEVFGHLQPDIARPDNYDLAGIFFIHRPADLDSALQGVELIDALGIYSGDRRPDGDGPRGNEQLVKGLFPGFSAFQVFSLHPLLTEIDFRNLLKNPGVDPLLFPESFRGSDHQAPYVIDNPADVVGNRSGGVRRMRALFKGKDFERRFLTAGLRSSAHSCCVAADYDESFFGHE